MEERRFTFLGEPDEGKTKLRFGTFIIKDGSQVRFWEDSWLGNSSLRDQYPQLYNIVRKKQDTVADVLSTQIPNLSWRRDLIGIKLVIWNNLVSCLSTIDLTPKKRWLQMELRPDKCFFSKITLSGNNQSKHT